LTEMAKRYIDRSSPRKKVDIAARLIVPAARYTIIPCRIVDRSEGGTKVVMHVSFPLPCKLFLLGDESEDLYECERRWQNETEVGLKLIDICVHSTRRTVLANAADAIVIGPPTEVESTVSELLPPGGGERPRRRPRPSGNDAQ
jgi:hypothetical protein